MKLSNFINGQFQIPVSGDYIDDFNPATGEVIARIPSSGERDVENAVSAASSAFGSWSQVSLQERAQICISLAEKIESHLEELARLESRDTGKPFALAYKGDIPRAAQNFRVYAELALRRPSELFPMETAFNYTQRMPLGVVGLITPWNLPLLLLTWKLAPALMMGNTVVAKPSEFTPLTANRLAELSIEAGLPAGVFNLVHGTGHGAGQALVSHPSVKAISFTGGTATGAKIASTAAPSFKKVSLELGGKNPSIVFADCEFETTIKGVAKAAFTNQGQVCLCGSRILIEDSIYDRFVSAFLEEIRNWTIGDPSSEQSALGSLISLAHRDKVESFVEDAKRSGSRILAGGKRPTLPAPFSHGAFFEPTVIDGASPDSRLTQEEVFGPVVSLYRFRSEQEAVAIANGVRYGLSASVWTNNLKRAHSVSQKLQAGTVWVNTWNVRDLRVPFGGVKESGVGREGGYYSLDFFSNQKNICIQLGD